MHSIRARDRVLKKDSAVTIPPDTHPFLSRMQQPSSSHFLPLLPEQIDPCHGLVVNPPLRCV